MTGNPWRQLSAAGIAAMGMATICILAFNHVIQDGETIGAMASVLSASVAIGHKDDNSGEGGNTNG